jgi:protein-S-isoprenylcysteine O-methyltransferase Ste14
MSWLILIQVAYLAAFAAIHSLLASSQFKISIWHFFGQEMDRWYMKFFVLIAAVTIIPLVLMMILFPGKKIYVVRSPWRWLMFFGQILASLGIMLGFKDAHPRFSISQQLSKAEEVEPLRNRGIYCFVRDPFLLSGLVSMWLTPFMTTRLFVIYILTSVYLYLGSLHWESRLLAQFGKDYEDYRKNMPRMIPWERNSCSEINKQIKVQNLT